MIRTVFVHYVCVLSALGIVGDSASKVIVLVQSTDSNLSTAF